MMAVKCHGRNDPGNVDDVALDDDVGDNLACQHDDIDDPFQIRRGHVLQAMMMLII